MLTLHLAPRRGSVLRAAWASVEVTAMLVLGHSWAGSSLPSLAWILVMAAVLFGVGVLVLQERVRLRYAVPGLVAVQVLLHAWLTVLTSGPHASHSAEVAGHGHSVLEPSMLAVHVGAALMTALVWELRARARDVIITWARPLPLPVARRQSMSPSLALPAGHLLSVVSIAPRRGPPRTLVRAPA